MFARFSYDQAVSFIPGGSDGFAEQGAFASTQNITNHGRNFALSETHVFSDRTLNQINAGFNRIFNKISSFGNGTCKAQQLGIPGANLGGASCGLTSTQLSTYWALGDRGFAPFQGGTNVFSISDSFDMIRGNHDIHVGGSIRANQMNVEAIGFQDGFWVINNDYSGDAAANLLLGLPDLGLHDTLFQGAITGRRWKIFRPFVQDDWRVTKRLTLNLGLRLSLYGTYRERYQHAFSFDPNAFQGSASPAIDDGSFTGQAGAFVPDTGNPFNGIVQCGGPGGNSLIPSLVTSQFSTANVGANKEAGCMKGHLFNPAPRIGLAWDPKGDGKMAIRGGYGVFLEHTNGNEANTESLEGSPPFSLNASQFNINGYGNIGGGLLFPLNVTSIPDKAIWPYVQQWHLDVQKEFPGHFITTVSYVGSKGTHLSQQRNSNQIVPVSANPFAPGQPITQADCDFLASDGTLANGKPVTGQAVTNLGVACGNDPNPSRPQLGFGDITRLEDQANSIYHALQTSVHRTVGDLTLSLAYTYSHSIDSSSDRFDGAFVNSYDLATNRGSSNFDVRHNLAISYVYGLPFFKGSGLTHTLLGGWQISGITIAQTGTPFSVTNGTDFGDAAGVANGVGTGSRPDLVGDPHGSVQSNVPGVRGPLLYNPAAFRAPTGLTFGNVGRNTLAGPGRINFDFGLFKRFSFGETRALDLRWENYNLFNHTQYNGVSSSMDCAPVGATAADPSCIGSSSFLHASGAHLARRMQFGLRFQF